MKDGQTNRDEVFENGDWCTRLAFLSQGLLIYLDRFCRSILFVLHGRPRLCKVTQSITTTLSHR